MQLGPSGLTTRGLAAIGITVVFAVSSIAFPLAALARPNAGAQLSAVVTLASESRGIVATYKVQNGDSLLGIAELLAVDVDTLGDLNNLTDANAIQAGQLLVVPDTPNRPVRFGLPPAKARSNGDAPAFVWPSIGPITTPFGVPGSMWIGGYHRGIDIGAPSGSPIIAASDGTVEFAEFDRQHGYGNYVLIDHGNGYETLYGHMSQIGARAGLTVQQGDIIGYVGMTGYATGPHLHFEVRHNAEKINPEPLLP